MPASHAEDAISDEILSYYNQAREIDRLSSGLGQLEFLRTQEIMERYLPSSPAVIYDVGGGPGAYALWLAQQGYEVHLIDPVPLHLEQATERSAAQPDHPIAQIVLGDARYLALDDDTADALILHGPLYHLLSHDDRLVALTEAARVLRPGGILLAFAIPAYASTLLGLQRWWMHDPDYRAMCAEELATGIHRRPSSWPNLFTTAYFHHRAELEAEVTGGGFECIATLAIEGPAVIVPDLDARLADNRDRAILLSLIRSLEKDEVALGMTAHMVTIARTSEDFDSVRQ